jgi:hypothetical protein
VPLGREKYLFLYCHSKRTGYVRVENEKNVSNVRNVRISLQS